MGLLLFWNAPPGDGVPGTATTEPQTLTLLAGLASATGAVAVGPTPIAPGGTVMPPYFPPRIPGHAHVETLVLRLGVGAARASGSGRPVVSRDELEAWVLLGLDVTLLDVDEEAWLLALLVGDA